MPLDRFGHLLFDVRLGDVAASSRPREKLVLPRGPKFAILRKFPESA